VFWAADKSMFDAQIRPLINPALDVMARRICKLGIGANVLTLFGAAIGLAAAAAIANEQNALALVLIAANRMADGLDGRVAQINGPTEFGGYLDSLCDFLFYVAVPVAFGIASAVNLFPALLLVAAFTLTGVSFLAFAAIAARQGQDDGAHGRKAIIYSTGLMEGTETIAFFIVMCLLPGWFAQLSYVFSLLCLITVAQRIRGAAKQFG
jgi:phosphatidylglycerophosphate synthase